VDEDSVELRAERASFRRRDDSGVRFLVNGRYDGTIDLAEGLALPANAAKSDFVASIVWP